MGNTVIKLKAKGKNEEIILEYLKQNASLALTERINTGTKTLTQCWNYIVKEAQKAAVNGCACIEDSTVYGWAIHFFEEDSIDGKAYDKAAAKVKTVTSEDKPCEPYVEPKEDETSKPVKKAKKAPEYTAEQFSLADLFG